MNDEEFSEALLNEEKVGVVPGSCFGVQDGGMYVCPTPPAGKILLRHCAAWSGL